MFTLNMNCVAWGVLSGLQGLGARALTWLRHSCFGSSLGTLPFPAGPGQQKEEVRQRPFYLRLALRNRTWTERWRRRNAAE